MEEEPLIFEKKGFPSIKVFNEHFEIKAIDYWEFRTFNYSDIKEITHYNPNDKWWNKLYIMTSLTAQIFSKEDPWILKIIRINGGDWTYKTSYKSNSEFKKIINLIRLKLNN
ncbi:hypothetical protein [Ulvibacter litoralis]|uniref:Uncharacterized protein n=2 Tax=Ulvibacter litoralis TaxID=227084 RepID=A0A1G7JS48_9FLAO|nr:hypothetical protein [Ulvibacter litoralis]SDF27787.1 hypothetical protein SAMN05421855_1271 [Ulvibacter litoralis]